MKYLLWLVHNKHLIQTNTDNFGGDFWKNLFHGSPLQYFGVFTFLEPSRMGEHRQGLSPPSTHLHCFVSSRHCSGRCPAGMETFLQVKRDISIRFFFCPHNLCNFHTLRVYNDLTRWAQTIRCSQRRKSQASLLVFTCARVKKKKKKADILYIL